MATSTLTFHGRLPGVDCTPALPQPGSPVRLDVTGFVGLADRGPVDHPVPVEDVNEYRSVFGGEKVLATDQGVPLYANLPTAVQAFFDNGGRRCQVVRVCGPGARAARWTVPGLRIVQPDGSASEAYVQAAWPGSWSDGYRVETDLLSTPVRTVAPYDRTNRTVAVAPADATGFRAGDLLRLGLPEPHPSLYVRIASVTGGLLHIDAEVPFTVLAPSPPEPDGRPVEVLLDPAVLTGLPASVAVDVAWLVQFELVERQVVEGVHEQLRRWLPLALAPAAATSWLDVLQPLDDLTPDLTRSMVLRADADTVAAARTGVVVPLNMGQFSAADDPSSTAVATGTDDLAGFDAAELFLDDRLADLSVYSLLPTADELTVLSSSPATLRGIHALVEVEEVALVAVPDAVQPPWSAGPSAPPAPVPTTPPELSPPDWTHFRDCRVPTAPPPVTPPPPPPPPVVTTPDLPTVDPYTTAEESALLRVQSALVTMCAARGDMVAVLGVPRHFDAAATAGWLHRLAAGQPTGGDSAAVSPLGYAGLWHPWLRVVEPTTPELAPTRDCPADGAVTGMIAARELDRGVWTAPANQPLRGVIGLGAELTAAQTTQLFDLHANVLHQRPGAITAWSAHTLADDPRVLQVSVRRLLILLRKIALLEGNRYVFDVNSDRFRQLVRLRFERILQNLVRLGALAAAQVVTAGGFNTPEDLDDGRLIVGLQVAPTTPIEFITVSLLRAGEDLLDVVVGR